MITWSPNNKGDYVVLSNNNLTAACTNLTNCSAVATKGYSSGKWYWEITVVQLNGIMIGICSSAFDPKGSYITDYNWLYYRNGSKYHSTNTPVSYGSSYTIGDTIGIALDLDNLTLTFYKNGVSQGVAYTLSSGTNYYPIICNASGGGTCIATAAFLSSSFKYSIPSGFNSYDIPYKYLIKDNDSILYTYDGTNIIQSPLQTIDVDNFNNNGLDDPTIISEEIWDSTFPDKTGLQLLMYTEDTTKTESTIEYNVPEYCPVDKLDNQFQIKKYIPN